MNPDHLLLIELTPVRSEASRCPLDSQSQTMFPRTTEGDNDIDGQ